MRLGILGGSFDPVHYAHLLLAECCRETCGLDEVWFVPAFVAPHKTRQGVSDSKHRVEMLNLAAGGNPAFRVSDVELRRGGISYTVQTLQELAEESPDAELFFLMGADSLRDLPNWREPAEVCRLAIPVVVRRPDWPEPDYQSLAPIVTEERLAEIRQYEVVMPLMQLSSTEIRSRVASNRSIRYWTPPAVEKYIQSLGLYRNPS